MSNTYPAKKLVVAAPAKAAQGTTVSVTVTGLEPVEKYTIAIGSTVLASGKAPAKGPLTKKVALGKTGKGPHKLVATGQAANRTGSTSLTVSPSDAPGTTRKG
ncbi:MAG: hypothetical protein JWR83_58 [Aeromicrobium sp.]|nr:hypothetical protein [Aeromicrobium sp.]